MSCAAKSVKPAHEDQPLSGDLSNSSSRLNEAALWLSANYDAVAGNRLLELMARFELSVHEAVAASKRAHALRYAGQAAPAS